MNRLMKKRNILVVGGIVGLVLAILIVSQAIAWGPRGMGMGPGMGWMAYLNLTQEQATKLNSLRQNFLKDTLATRSKLATVRVELQTLFAQAGVDDARLRAKHGEMLKLQRELQEKRFEFRLAVRKILTPEQLAQASLGWGRGMGRYGRMGRCRRMLTQ